MSEREPPPTQAKPPTRRGKRSGLPLGLILAVLLLVYAVIFVVLNSDEVKVNFLFFSTRISLVVAIVLVLAIGFAAGYLVHDVRSRRRHRARASTD
jgi:lipopolysaccharide assembly protein A